MNGLHQLLVQFHQEIHTPQHVHHLLPHHPPTCLQLTHICLQCGHLILDPRRLITGLPYLHLQFTKVGPDPGKPLLVPLTHTCQLVHQHHPNGAVIPHPLLHPPIRILTPSLTVETPLQELPLVGRCIQPWELMMTHMMGCQNKVFVIQIHKQRLWLIGVTPLKEGCSWQVRCMDILTRRLSLSAYHQDQ